MSIQDRINSESVAQVAAAEATGTPIAEMMVVASVLALSLFQLKAMPCSEYRVEDGKVIVPRCLDKEHKRVKGWPQLPAGSTLRGWENFDPKNLCNCCRPYWHAEMCAAGMRWLAEIEAMEKPRHG